LFQARAFFRAVEGNDGSLRRSSIEGVYLPVRLMANKIAECGPDGYRKEWAAHHASPAQRGRVDSIESATILR
jgi:hypothetical protein